MSLISTALGPTREPHRKGKLHGEGAHARGMSFVRPRCPS